jgi:hypothetical protein
MYVGYHYDDEYIHKKNKLTDKNSVENYFQKSTKKLFQTTENMEATTNNESNESNEKIREIIKFHHDQLRKKRQQLFNKQEIHLIDQSLPQILHSKSITEKITTEIKMHHKYFSSMFSYNENFPRMYRILAIGTAVVIMLFIQSVTYNLANPDDGTCETFKSESTCIQLKSAFATGEAMCQWVNNSCLFIEPDTDVKVILFVAIFASCLTAPISSFCYVVIKQVLAAETSNNAEVHFASCLTAPIILFCNLVIKQVLPAETINNAKVHVTHEVEMHNNNSKDNEDSGIVTSFDKEQILQSLEEKHEERKTIKQDYSNDEETISKFKSLKKELLTYRSTLIDAKLINQLKEFDSKLQYLFFIYLFFFKLTTKLIKLKISLILL